MKQFPWKQYLIWEDDVEKIEWMEFSHFVWKGPESLARLEKNGAAIVGEWRIHTQTGETFFDSNGVAYEVHEIYCWVKL